MTYVSWSPIPSWRSNALLLITDMENDTTSLCFPPVLPKESVSTHSNTPVIWAIPLHLHEADKFTALVNVSCLSLLFIPHAECIPIEAALDEDSLLSRVARITLCHSPDDLWSFSSLWASLVGPDIKMKSGRSGMDWVSPPLATIF